MSGISAGKAIGYAMMPGIYPRLKGLFFSGFGTVAYFLAIIYSMVRLIPANHPYRDERNIGQFGVRHVIAAALHELRFEWRNIDQIIVFFALLAGTAGLLMYIIGIAAFLLVSPVSAAIFETTMPATDIAFMMLDRVFGVPDIYNSEVTTNLVKYGPFPNNFQVGMQALFQFYTMGLFMLSVLVFLYHIVVIVVETNVTGTPFGHRFDNPWIPLRMVIALALLIPGSTVGLNSAQFIVLYAAKYGSGLATNTWITYNLRTGDTPLGTENRNIISRPAIPDYSNLIKDLIMVRGCMEMYMYAYSPALRYGVSEFLVKGAPNRNATGAVGPVSGDPRVQPLLPVESAAILPNVTSRFAWSTRPSVSYNGYNGTFLPTLSFYNGGDIRIVFGAYMPDFRDKYPGGIFPYCGELVVPVTGHTPEALYVAEGYLSMVVRILYGFGRNTSTVTADERALFIAALRPYMHTSSHWRDWTVSTLDPGGNPECNYDKDNDGLETDPGLVEEFPQLGNCEQAVPAQYWNRMFQYYQNGFSWAPLAGYDYLTGEVGGEDLNFSIGNVYYAGLGHINPMLMDLGILSYGWGGAGLWYNKIAERNGSLIAAVGAAPYLVKYPYIMEKIKEQRLKNDKSVESTGCEVFNPNKANMTSIDMPDQSEQLPAEAALGLYILCKQMADSQQSGNNTRSTKQMNPIMNMINSLFGASSFFNLLDNREVHPMAMLVTLGKTLIDKAVFNMIAAAGTSVIGGINQLSLGKGDPGFAYITIASANLSKAFTSFGLIALVSGVLLFYVLPFLPFMYFFFAVGRWVKTIFEAMVGVPLWAMAHLSMEGPGLPGKAASAGYFLILEIFIRPALTVLSLVAAFSTFAAMVIVLNTIFEIVLANIFGTDIKLITAGADASLANMRNLVDQLFMTVVYVIIVYMIGTSSFKLIDLIPDNIMRWSGAGVKSWGGSDIADDLVDQAGTKYIALPTYYGYKSIMQDGIGGVAQVFAGEAQETIAAANAAKAAKPPGTGGGGTGTGTGTGTGGGTGNQPPTPQPQTPAPKPQPPSGPAQPPQTPPTQPPAQPPGTPPKPPVTPVKQTPTVPGKPPKPGETP